MRTGESKAQRTIACFETVLRGEKSEGVGRWAREVGELKGSPSSTAHYEVCDNSNKPGVFAFGFFEGRDLNYWVCDLD